MGYQTVILPDAEKDLDRLSPPIRNTILRRIKWLAENTQQVIHHPLVGLPEDLAGLCKLRVGDHRILYWKSGRREEIQVFRVRHRSEVYRRL